ncbi:hypothetical protein FKM82_028469, partial [Ascaphus truei]
QAQAKANAKTYEFRSESARGVRVLYPGRPPQELPSRSREGLRSIPTSSQGSSGAGGEIFRERLARAEDTVESYPLKIKRRHEKGLHKIDPQPLRTSPTITHGQVEQASDTGRVEESGPVKFHSARSVIQLARRQNVEFGASSQAGSGYLPRERGLAQAGQATHGQPGTDAHPHRTKHRAGFLGSKCQETGVPRARHGSGRPGRASDFYRGALGRHGRKPSLIARIPVSRILGEPEEEPWRPPKDNLEKVVVTDVTSNFLTVTIKESSTDQGFFKAKR